MSRVIEPVPLLLSTQKPPPSLSEKGMLQISNDESNTFTDIHAQNAPPSPV
jgi:hypothetical protein